MRPLFIYGTLMAGQPQGGLLRGLPRTKAIVRGALFRLPQGYPAIRLEGRQAVQGQLVEGIDTRRMQLLDEIEGVGQSLYERMDCEAIVGLRQVAAQVYAMRDPLRSGGIPIPSGRWRGVIRRGHAT